jgi:DNA polymerase elongation subunit (family B)
MVFENFGDVFSDFVSHFESIRKDGGYYKFFAKLMINSLYGGMALKNENLYNYITFSDSEFEFICKNLNISKFYKVNNVFIILIHEDYKFKKIFNSHIIPEKSNRNVTYSAAIAAKARIKLHKFIMKVEIDGGRVLYTDTDSVFAAYNKIDTREYIGEEK